MILFPEIGSWGRLGNQLFQLAVMKALALENNTECYLPEDIYEREWHGQTCLLNFFDHKIPLLPMKDIKNFSGTHFYDNVREAVNQNFFTLKDNVALHGQFESEKYFEKYKEQVKELFILKEPIESESKRYIENLRERYPGHEIVAIHYRRGDAHINVADPMPFFHFVTKIKQYFFSEQPYIFLVFTGGSREQGNSNETDMNFLKDSLKQETDTVFCDVNNTILEFGIMSKCDHLIMTSGSTFTWWAGYINKNPNKKIIVPKYQMGHLFYPDVLWPEEFIKFW
jgi:hypothetical protein